MYRKFVMNKLGKVIFYYWSGDSISRSYFDNIVLIDKHPVIWIFSQNIYKQNIIYIKNLWQQHLLFPFTSAMFLLFNEYLEVPISFKYTQSIRAVEKGGEQWGIRPPRPLPPPSFPGAKSFFPCKIGKHNIFACE